MSVNETYTFTYSYKTQNDEESERERRNLNEQTVRKIKTNVNPFSNEFQKLGDRLRESEQKILKIAITGIHHDSIWNDFDKFPSKDDSEYKRIYVYKQYNEDDLLSLFKYVLEELKYIHKFEGHTEIQKKNGQFDANLFNYIKLYFRAILAFEEFRETGIRSLLYKHDSILNEAFQPKNDIVISIDEIFKRIQYKFGFEFQYAAYKPDPNYFNYRYYGFWYLSLIIFAAQTKKIPENFKDEVLLKNIYVFSKPFGVPDSHEKSVLNNIQDSVINFNVSGVLENLNDGIENANQYMVSRVNDYVEDDLKKKKEATKPKPDTLLDKIDNEVANKRMIDYVQDRPVLQPISNQNYGQVKMTTKDTVIDVIQNANGKQITGFQNTIVVLEPIQPEPDTTPNQEPAQQQPEQQPEPEIMSQQQPEPDTTPNQQPEIMSQQQSEQQPDTTPNQEPVQQQSEPEIMSQQQPEQQPEPVQQQPEQQPTQQPEIMSQQQPEPVQQDTDETSTDEEDSDSRNDSGFTPSASQSSDDGIQARSSTPIQDTIISENNASPERLENTVAVNMDQSVPNNIVVTPQLSQQNEGIPDRYDNAQEQDAPLPPNVQKDATTPNQEPVKEPEKQPEPVKQPELEKPVETPKVESDIARPAISNDTKRIDPPKQSSVDTPVEKKQSKTNVIVPAIATAIAAASLGTYALLKQKKRKSKYKN